MPEPLFTVVLTTYNRRTLVLEAIQSVLSQTCRDYELLVIDNGSSDGTAQAVEQVTDPRLTYLCNPQPTASCDVPRNLGIARARGTYVAFLDDDDVWYLEKLSKVRAAFAQHPEAGAVCHFEYRRVNGVIDGVLKHGPWSDHFFEQLLYERNCLSSCATTIKLDVLRQLHGFTIRPEMDGVADYDLWLRMAAQGIRVHFLEEPLGEFRMTGGNWSVVDAATQSRVAFIVREHLLQYEQRRLARLSMRGSWRLFQMDYLAGRALLATRAYRAALRCFGEAATLLLLKPRLLEYLMTVRAHKAFAGQVNEWEPKTLTSA